MKLHYSDAKHPLIVLTGEGEVTENDIPQILDAIKKPLDLDRPADLRREHVTIWDLSGITGGIGIFARDEINVLRKDLVAKNAFENCHANAFVCTSALIRGAVTAIGWVVGWPVPTKFFKDIESAQKWLITQYDWRDRWTA